jgi:hypothetical protein
MNLSGGELVAPMKAFARTAAEAHEVPVDLFSRIPEVESAWNPWATRFEPAFTRFYTNPALRLQTSLETERQHQRTSWGLCQIMGWTARSEVSYTGPIPALCDPQVSLDLGAKYLRLLYERAKPQPSWRWAITAYNHGEHWHDVNPSWWREGYTAKYHELLSALGEA